MLILDVTRSAVAFGGGIGHDGSGTGPELGTVAQPDRIWQDIWHSMKAPCGSAASNQA